MLTIKTVLHPSKKALGIRRSSCIYLVVSWINGKT
jgi:hypothetical protein